ncbi:F-box/kelch-repeat protein At3g23880-like [Silene latifolia]|uniref:F-box/kelch-repeat protein At3g23880-like n=1 Tax=Silene latifolia TaxID=37657 RepID=UPI003D772354
MAVSFQRYMQTDGNSQLIQLFKERSEKERERSIGIVIGNGYCLDEGVIVEILSWLPVKWLLQYKSVCKSWHAIISSSDFISKHLNNYYRRNNDDHSGVLLAQYHLDAYFLQSFVMVIDETPRVLARENMLDMPMYVSEICGPCDGLYYLYYYFDDKRALWNPAINELRVLPPLLTKNDPLLNPTEAPGEVYGLGFDSVSGDYKVVVIKGYLSNVTDWWNIPQSVIVYSVKNDCWRYCGDLRRYYELDRNKCYNFINGCYYWMESDYVYEDNKTCDAIICFNFVTDGCEEINLPEYQRPASKCLGIYDDSLAFLSVHRDTNCFEIWTLTESTWSLKFRIGPFSTGLRPVGHWKDNKLILESDYFKLALFDAESQDIKDLSFKEWKPCRGIFDCRESLVSVKGERNWEQGEDNTAIDSGSSPIEMKESDSEFGIRELFSCETSESDSEYGIEDLFCYVTSESDSEYGIQDLFCHEG